MARFAICIVGTFGLVGLFLFGAAIVVGLI
jgi:hypothetical protein